MKKMALLIIPLILLMVMNCSHQKVPQRDIMLEVAASMNDIFNAPTTRSRELYSRYCSVCHGLNGKGDGFNAFNLDPKPRSFTDSSFIARIDSELIQETITKGGAGVGLSPLMPPWGSTLTKKDIELLTAHVISLSKQ